MEYLAVFSCYRPASFIYIYKCGFCFKNEITGGDLKILINRVILLLLICQIEKIVFHGN